MKDRLGQGKHVRFSIFVLTSVPAALQSSGQGSIIHGTCKPTISLSDLVAGYPVWIRVSGGMRWVCLCVSSRCSRYKNLVPSFSSSSNFYLSSPFLYINFTYIQMPEESLLVRFCSGCHGRDSNPRISLLLALFRLIETQHFICRAGENEQWHDRQMELVHRQLQIFENGGQVRSWTIALRKAEHIALTKKNKDGITNTNQTPTCWERFLVPYLGANKTFTKVREVLDVVQHTFDRRQIQKP